MQIPRACREEDTPLRSSRSRYPRSRQVAISLQSAICTATSQDAKENGSDSVSIYRAVAIEEKRSIREILKFVDDQEAVGSSNRQASAWPMQQQVVQVQVVQERGQVWKRARLVAGESHERTVFKNA